MNNKKYEDFSLTVIGENTIAFIYFTYVLIGDSNLRNYHTMPQMAQVSIMCE